MNIFKTTESRLMLIATIFLSLATILITKATGDWFIVPLATLITTLIYASLCWVIEGE